jgi:hypothetical protein
MKDRTGNLARLPLSHYSKLQPQVEAEVVTASFMSDVPASEVVYRIRWQTLSPPIQSST